MTHKNLDKTIHFYQNVTVIMPSSPYFQMVSPTLTNNLYENSFYFSSNAVTMQNEAENASVTYVSNFIESFSSVVYQFVESNVAKDKVDTMIVHTASTSIYYGMTAPLLQNPSLTVKTNVAMGLKVFSAVANPFIAEFVETLTDTHIKNFKNLYEKALCLYDITSCDNQDESLSDFGAKVNGNVIEDIFQLDFGKISSAIYQNVNQLSLNDLIISGYTSVTASEIKDYTYQVTGFDQYCQGYFCKNWFSYYYKETVKNVLKSELHFTKTLSWVDEISPFKAELKPLALNDVITLESTDVFAGIISQNLTQEIFNPLKAASEELSSNQSYLMPLIPADHFIMEMHMIMQHTEMCIL